MKILRKGLLATLALTLPITALATSPVEVDGDKVKVTFADLDIHEKAGAEVLYSRLQQASKKACDVKPLNSLGSIKRASASKACYAETLDGLVTRIDSEPLRQIHAG